MMGNYHVRFLGGKGGEILLPYPVQRNNIQEKKKVIIFKYKIGI